MFGTSFRNLVVSLVAFCCLVHMGCNLRKSTPLVLYQEHLPKSSFALEKVEVANLNGTHCVGLIVPEGCDREVIDNLKVQLSITEKFVNRSLEAGTCGDAVAGYVHILTVAHTGKIEFTLSRSSDAEWCDGIQFVVLRSPQQTLF